MPDQNKTVVEKANEYQVPDRTCDKGIVGEKGSSAIIRGNGDVALTASEMAQYKLGHDNSTATEVSLQSNTITNRKNILADEIIINNHKFNPQLFDLADIQQLVHNQKAVIGNLTMTATVLVKAWEPSLNKYVLIRRPARFPVFSPTLNLADVSEQFGFENLDVENEIKKIQEDIAKKKISPESIGE